MNTLLDLYNIALNFLIDISYPQVHPIPPLYFLLFFNGLNKTSDHPDLNAQTQEYFLNMFPFISALISSPDHPVFQPTSAGV